MKKILALSMAGLFVFMTACGRISEAHEEVSSEQKVLEDEAMADADILLEEEDEKAEEASEDETVKAVGKGAITEVPTIYESIWDRSFEHMVGTEFTGDLGGLFEELKDIDIDGDGLTDIVWFTVDTESDTPSSGIEVRFGNGDSVEAGGMESAFNEDIIVTFRDIDANGANEILVVSYIESTGGPVATDIFLIRLENEDWVSYSLWDYDNGFIYMHDEENRINDFIGEEYYIVRDAELTENGVAILCDLGMKDGPTQYLDYFGVAGVLLEDKVEVVEVGKEVAEEYWPVDMEISKDQAMPE